MSPTPYERPHAHFTYEATGLDSELTQGITLRERGTEEMQQLKGVAKARSQLRNVPVRR